MKLAINVREVRESSFQLKTEMDWEKVLQMESKYTVQEAPSNC